MKKLLAALLLVAVAAVVAVGQPGTLKVHTRPACRSTEALERMSLKLAWSAPAAARQSRRLCQRADHSWPGRQSAAPDRNLFGYRRPDGRRDGRPALGEPGRQGLFAGPGACGQHQFHFHLAPQCAACPQPRHRVESAVHRGQVHGRGTNGIDLPYMPSAAPAADDTMLYFVMDTRAVLFRLPVYGSQGEALRYRIGGEEVPVLPEPGLFYPVGNEYLQLPPLVAGKQFTVATAEGTMVSMSRLEQKVIDEYTLDSKVLAMPGQYDIMAYIGTVGGTLYAINMDKSKMRWRFLPGGGIVRQPAVLDRDIFVTADKVGLFRVDRDTGRELWVAKRSRPLPGRQRQVRLCSRLARRVSRDRRACAAARSLATI